MLMLIVRAETPLVEPDEDLGFVTWLDATIERVDDESREPVGTARVALIHVANAMNRGVELGEVLDADSEELNALRDVFFEPDGDLNDEFVNGTGFDVLYFSTIELLLPWQRRSIDQALVRRLCDTFGESCAIAVLPIIDAEDQSGWHAMGFQVARKPTTERCGYMFLDLAASQPDVVSADPACERFTIATVRR
jgi:hypothetical protein